MDSAPICLCVARRQVHLLFNMATGSGKILIMAGLILYLYEQGYRNFLFFVNFTNIIEKTKDNFLNPASIKYLFNRDIHIGNRRVNITPAENFEAVNPNDINICFTTIQKLHSDLASEKENALTFEDFRKHRIVLIADEAHHMNVKTRALSIVDLSAFRTGRNVYGLDENRLGKLSAMSGMCEIKSEIHANVTDYEGTRGFRRDWVREVFKDKALKFDAQNPRAADDSQFEYFVSAKDWFAFNTIYDTGEEKAFVRMLDRQMQKL